MNNKPISFGEDDSPKEELKKIQTIPDDFYGGKNPTIFEVEEKSVSDNILKIEKNIPPKTDISVSKLKDSGMEFGQFSSNQPFDFNQKQDFKKEKDFNFEANLKKGNKIPIIIFLSILFLIFVFAGFYFYNRYLELPKIKQENRDLASSNEKIVNNVDSLIKEEIVEVKEEPVEILIETVTSSPEIQIPLEEKVYDFKSVNSSTFEFPNLIIATSNDGDKDNLTDKEEEIFKTDRLVFDTDNDGYFDGLEVENLYDPVGATPKKIIFNENFKDLEETKLPYRIYLPKEVSISYVLENKNHVLLTFPESEYIEIQSYPKLKDELFVNWFGRVIKNTSFNDFQNRQNRFKENVYWRKNNLQALIEDKDFVHIFMYNPGFSGSINYPKVFEMIVQSFRRNDNYNSLPEQSLLKENTIISSTIFSTSTQISTNTIKN